MDKKRLQTSSNFDDKIGSASSIVSLQQRKIRPQRPSIGRVFQNFLLVWLDENIDEDHSSDCRNTITQLRQVVNNVIPFTDVDRCIDLITDIEHEEVFMIVSETFGQTIVPIVQDIVQIYSIYILCGNSALHEQWIPQRAKIKGVFTDITLLCKKLKKAAKECDQNSVSISFVASSTAPSSLNWDQIDPSFRYMQILKEILLTIDFDQGHFMEFITYYRQQFVDNIDKFEREYRNRAPIWWYTYPCSLYSMLNRALRTMEVDLIIKMGFFVRDLHEHIAQLHSEQYAGHAHSTSFTVYRGQGMFTTDFDRLKHMQGGLMCFNNFLSTSLDRAVSLAFAESNQNDPDLIGVFFEITIDLSKHSVPFAKIRDASYFQEEVEILFSMNSLFRIGQIKQVDNNPRLWQVSLSMIDDDDPKLRALTDRIREDTRGSIGWDRLGKLLVKLGMFEKAEELYRILLAKTSNDAEKAHFYHQLGYIREDLGDYEAALDNYEKSLHIKQDTLPPDDLHFALFYNSMGSVYDKMGEYSKALSFYKKSLEIYREKSPEDHSSLATCYSNIGSAYRNMGDYVRALSFHEKSLVIDQNTLPENHPSLAISYNNIGLVYDDMKDYSKALASYERALEIYKKVLLPNHPDLTTAYNNLGSVYNNMGVYSKALSIFEKVLEICEKTALQIILISLNLQ